jgi:hypothetical protein
LSFDPETPHRRFDGRLLEITLKRFTAKEKARKDKRAGKAPTTQAGEFVHEEIRKVRRGEHGVRSPKQAIAIGLSKARRAGVALRPRGKGKAKAKTRKSAQYAYEAGQGKRKPRRRLRVSRAVSQALKREPRNTTSRAALSTQSDAPPHAAATLTALLQPEKPPRRKARQPAPLRPRRQREPDRVANSEGRVRYRSETA